MERKMYKEKRQLSAEETQALFVKGHHGILSVNGDDGYPYAVPVNYVFIDGKIYIHSAKYGYKIDALKQNDKVCLPLFLIRRLSRINSLLLLRAWSLLAKPALLMMAMKS